MGGQLALYAAQEHGGTLACAVDFYGIHPNVRIEPSRLRVPVLGHFGTRDSSVPVDAVKRLQADVTAAGGKFTAHFYDADHAFFNDTRPQVYHAAAARIAWQRTLEFLRANLA
jgi:carboxymethylenebutenolidase